MNELEMTKLCAEAMGLYAGPDAEEFIFPRWRRITEYDPLHDDAQAMALLRAFSLALWGSDQSMGEWKWHAEVQHWGDDELPPIGHGVNPNRAIVECVAKMQKAKKSK
jgi:hypothetical protein